MNSLNIYIGLLKIRRAAQIISILVKHTFANVLKFNRYRIVHHTVVRNKVHTTPERIRMLIEELGPTYIKFGQIIADRPDVVNERYRLELKKLQSSVKPFDNKLAYALIEKELGCSINEVFSEFDPQPLAAASIGQVYSGTLKCGCPVVIKIQRPNIVKKIKLDITLMKHLALLCSRRYPEMAAINIVALVNDFAENIIEELDYSQEQSNTELFQRMFRNDPTVRIPYVWREYTTPRLLIMERIVGTTPNSAEELTEAGLDPKTVARNGANAIFKMILEDGIFHADPHAGNLFILENNAIAFIDFGMISVMRQREINFIADYSMGFIKKDNIAITKALITLCGDKFFAKEADVQYEIKRMLLRGFTDEAFDIKNFSLTMQSSIEIIVKYKMQIPSGVFMLIKTLLTLEKLATRLDPDINLSELIIKYSEQIIKSRYQSKRLATEVYDTALAYAKMFQELPSTLTEILYKLKEGKIKHDIKIEDERVFNSTFREMTLRVSYAIILIGLFIGSSILVVLEYESHYGLVVMYVSSALILLLIVNWIFRKR